MTAINFRFLGAISIALALTILPLPEWLFVIRPAWVLLLLLYVQFYIPRYFTLTKIILIGLCLDALLATIIGEHVFALVFATWLSSSLARRFNFFPIGQQMLLIFVFVFVYQLTLGLADAFLGYGYKFFIVLGSAAVSALIWPWVRVIADTVFFSSRKKDLSKI